MKDCVLRTLPVVHANFYKLTAFKWYIQVLTLIIAISTTSVAFYLLCYRLGHSNVRRIICLYVTYLRNNNSGNPLALGRGE